MMKMQIENSWQKILSAKMVKNHHLHYFSVTESTNTVAMELCLKGVKNGTIILADAQTKGRGRLTGRSWLSPKASGLYLSIILYPKLEPADYPKITLATGVAVCKALTEQTTAPIKLKWPNDLLINNRKCGGILTETGPFTGTGPTPVIIGIGLNINTPAENFPTELTNTATSIFMETSTYYDRGKLLSAIIKEMDSIINCLEQAGFAEILKDWQRLDAYKNRMISWVNNRGEAISGISLGPDEEGILHIQDDQGAIHTIISGDVSLVR